MWIKIQIYLRWRPGSVCFNSDLWHRMQPGQGSNTFLSYVISLSQINLRLILFKSMPFRTVAGSQPPRLPPPPTLLPQPLPRRKDLLSPSHLAKGNQAVLLTSPWLRGTRVPGATRHLHPRPLEPVRLGRRTHWVPMYHSPSLRLN